MIIRKTNYSYVVKKESVTVYNHNASSPQYISFNCYSLQSRSKFYAFQKEIEASTPDQYDNINDIYGLAREYEVRGSAGHKPTITDNIAF